MKTDALFQHSRVLARCETACRLDGREYRAAETAFRAVRKIRVMMVNAIQDYEEDLS